MKNQRNKLILFICFLQMGIHAQSSKMICRQGKVSFFSYTSVENIEATNNQVSSIVNNENGEIVVQMLMRAFVFKKALMEEHFNESYVESDKYPKLTFSGSILDFGTQGTDNIARTVKGLMDFHGVQKEVEISTVVEKEKDKLLLTGDFNVAIADFAIKVPPLLVPNIAKEIQVMFRFEYAPYED